MVLPRPCVPTPSHQRPSKPSASPVIELDPLPATDGEANLASPLLQPPTSAAAPRLPQSSTPGSPQHVSLTLASHRRRSSLQAIPQRKPVRGSKSMGTQSAYVTPWPGPDYVPDGAERARAARGESQAQRMILGDSTVDLGKASPRPVADGSPREGEKYKPLKG